MDRDQVMYYREDKAGQILQGRHQQGRRMASWIAAATSYSTNNRIMVPFYIYSMFGFQRIGDRRGLRATYGRAASCWAAPRATTLNGEGLQHEDGHSHILAGTIPNCVATTPWLRTKWR